MTQKVIILQGLPASGKSTWARAHVLANPEFIRVNKDELRRMLYAGYRRNTEKHILEVRDSIIKDALRSDKSVIVDDTNFNIYHTNHIEQLVNKINSEMSNYYGYNYDKIIIEKKIFNVDPVECIKRNALRSEEERVPEEVIWEMYEKYVKPNEYKESSKLVQDDTLPHAIIVDLDGTLALHNGRSPYECERAGDDSVNDAVQLIIEACVLDYYPEIIYISGRNERCRGVTEKWIDKHMKVHVTNPYKLFMRADGDNRKDSVVKLELFNNHIRDKYYIDFVLDDRDQVVDMWRNTLGLPCFQVNYGNF